jgi:uncharacterized protein YciI
MRNLLALTVISFLIISCSTPIESESTNVNDSTEGYDSLLAKETGADDYGMRKYVIAYLRKGPNRDQDSVEAANIQRAHLDNMTVMGEAKKLVLAGPFMDDGDVMGIYVFAVETLEEAEELTASDPAVTAGRLIMELHPWYGSAALMKINELHKKVSKEAI